MLCCQKSVEAMHQSKLEQLVAERKGDTPGAAEVEYLLNVAPILCEYSQQQERKARQAEEDEMEDESEMSECVLDGTMNNFIQVKRKIKDQATLTKLKIATLVEDEGSKAYQEAKTSHALLESRLHPEEDTCKKCNVPLLVVASESDLVCPECGHAQFFTDGTNGLTYEQEVNRVVIPAFAYKRANHLSEWLAQFQGKESTDIPAEVIDALRAEFRKARITSRHEISRAKVRALLKKLNYSKYYEHVPYIMKILGVSPPSMSQELEDKIRVMFLQCQTPFMKHRPTARKNFISYPYFLYKACQLLGEDQFLPCFPLLKSRPKLKAHDLLWQAICHELNWQFIPSMTAVGRTDHCTRHGGGRRCQTEGCKRSAAGKTDHCVTHGGGRRCITRGCTRSAVSPSDHCVTHGGGVRCNTPGCDKAAQAGTTHCIAHGGGRRCKTEGCDKSARGMTEHCITHGGGQRCITDGCDKAAQGGTENCIAHGGGIRCCVCSNVSVHYKGGACYECRERTALKRWEKQTTRWLNGLSWYCDETLPCAREMSTRTKSCIKRPDYVFVLESHVVVLEVDEDYHRYYNVACEVDRMGKIKDLIRLPIHFVRFNPAQRRYPLLEDLLRHLFANPKGAQNAAGMMVHFVGYPEERMQELSDEDEFCYEYKEVA
ncbi:hypothetical virus protein [Klebsormidium nitens]|uniref:Hypothetical virus protein n=1 Tax=Klebsormidium nitens TaxID=105231 RepID=A0A1Y1ING1_KLENI|nr:hypothetical virus protein [Klebsormidium nitens]|eukprot:GAQ90999.1 hypothetical virus protein [Klebsormidium nitens]